MIFGSSGKSDEDVRCIENVIVRSEVRIHGRLMDNPFFASIAFLHLSRYFCALPIHIHWLNSLGSRRYPEMVPREQYIIISM